MHLRVVGLGLEGSLVL